MNFKKMEDINNSTPKSDHPTMDDIKMVRISFMMPFMKSENSQIIKEYLTHDFGIPVTEATIVLEESSVTVDDLKAYGNEHLHVDFGSFSPFADTSYEVRDLIKHNETRSAPKPKAKPKKGK